MKMYKKLKDILEDGEITVRHGEDRTVLANWIAQKGDWDSIWSVLRLLRDMANGHEY